MGAIGCDEEGSILVKKANEDGVDTQYQYIDNIPTGKAALLNYLQPILFYFRYNLKLKTRFSMHCMYSGQNF